MENYKELLTALYKEHAPEKIDLIDSFLERYKGKEKQFYITQKAKYAKKRSVTDSKKILEDAMARIAARKKGDTTIKKEVISPKPPKKEEPKVIEPVITEKKTEAPKTIIKPKVEDEKKTTIIKDEKKKTPVIETPKKEEKKTDIKPTVIVDSTTKPKEPVGNEMPSALDIEKERIAEKEKKLEELKKTKEKIAQRKEKEKKKSRLVWYIALIALLILIIAGIVYYTSFYHQDDVNKEPVKVQKVAIDNQAKENEEKAVADSSSTEKAGTTAEETKEPAKEVVEKKPEAKPEKKKSSTRATADRLYSKDISHPTIFVACFAVKTESQAQQKVAMLKGKSLKAHYYWIPELDANGNSFFKVVVGPFNDAKSAYPSLTKVQERINFDAYLLIIE